MNSNQQSKTLSRGQQNMPATLERADIVIIGNGIAGLTAAIEARHYDPNKRIVMITDQLHPTINTPALKQYAIDKLQREQLLAYPPGTERAERIHIVNAHVEEIHAQSKYLGLDGNRAFGYETLLIATGSQPMGLPKETPGRAFDGVMMLHRLKDYLDLRRRLPEVHEAVVIGGGVHANETVMGLLHWGIRVHWLIRGKKFLSRILDDTASEMILNNVRQAGAIIHTETEVNAIIGRVGTVAGVITNTNEMLPCQLVLCCTGTRPAQGLAKQCTVPMKFKNGILVDDRLRTSVRDIYAAGDVAALPNPQTGDYETRAQWYSAVTEGKIAGAMMVGHSEVAKESFGVQWHATHLGELSMLNVGDPLGILANKQTVIHTDTNRGGYCRIAVSDDRLIGYLSVGTTQPDSLSIKRLIDEGLSIRDIIKPLLKGNFDAREYLTKTKARTARKMVTGQLPPPEQLQSLLLPENGSYRSQPSIQTIPAARQRDEIDLERQMQYTSREGASYQEPRLNRQSDALPVLSRESQWEGASPAPTGSRAFLEDEINPFSGNLPAVNTEESRKRPTNVYNEPISPRTPAISKTITRNLWQYATGEAPAREKIAK
jgi:NAD(P)H-nitrite reductase large subunit